MALLSWNRARPIAVAAIFLVLGTMGFLWANCSKEIEIAIGVGATYQKPVVRFPLLEKALFVANHHRAAIPLDHLPAGSVKPTHCPQGPSNITVAPLFGLCQFLTTTGKQGCCTTDPRDMPQLDVLCPYIPSQCMQLFVSYWCNAACNPELIQNCTAPLTNLSSDCLYYCPALQPFLPVMVGSNTSAGNSTGANATNSTGGMSSTNGTDIITPSNETMNGTMGSNGSKCSLPFLQGDTNMPLFTGFSFTNLSANAQVFTYNGSTKLVLNVTGQQPPPIFVLVQLNGTLPPPQALITLNPSGASLQSVYAGVISLPILLASWNGTGNNTWAAVVPITVDINQLYSRPFWNFTINTVAYTTMNYSQSNPLFLDVIVGATPPTSTNPLLQFCGPNTTSTTSASFNDSSSAGGLVYNPITTLVCSCSLECDFSAAPGATVQVGTFVVSAPVVTFSSVSPPPMDNTTTMMPPPMGPPATFVVTTSAMLGTHAFGPQLLSFYGAMLSFGCPVVLNQSTSFASAGFANTLNSTMQNITGGVSFTSGFSLSIQAPVEFDFMNVMWPLGMINVVNTTLTLVGCNSTFSAFSTLNLQQPSSALYTLAASDHMTAATINSVVLGTGSLQHCGGVLHIGGVVVSTNVTVGCVPGMIPTMAVRPTVPLNATVMSCATTFAKSFNFVQPQQMPQNGTNVSQLGNLRLVVDESCVSTFISNTLVVPAGAALHLVNVSGTSSPLVINGINGNFMVLAGGSLTVGFAAGAKTVLGQIILSYTSPAGASCGIPPSVPVTFLNAPAVDILTILTWQLPSYSGSTACYLKLLAAFNSSVYTVSVGLDPSVVSPSSVADALVATGTISNADLVVVTGISGSNPVIISLQCLGADRASANALCIGIMVAATTPGYSLYTRLNSTVSILSSGNTSVQTAIITLSITQAVTTYSNNLVVTSNATFGGAATQMVMGSTAVLLLQCPVNITSNYMFSGAADSTVAFNGATATFVAAVVSFSGPAVSFTNGTTVVVSGSSMVINSTSSCTVSQNAILTLANAATTLLTSGSTTTATVLSVVGGTITGSGRIVNTQGVISLSSSIILVPIVLSTTGSATRQVSAQATVKSCGDKMAAFTYGSSNTQLTIDTSCMVPTAKNYSSYLSGSLSLPSGATLTFTNVKNGSRPLYVGGSVSLLGSVVISFSSTTPVLSQSLIKFPVANSSMCVQPTNASVTYQSSPSSVSLQRILAVFDSAAGLCKLDVDAGFLSTQNYSLTLNKDYATFTAAKALEIFRSVGYDPNAINIVSIVPATVILTFQCLGSDKPSADAYCNNLYQMALDPNSALGLALGVISKTTTTTPSPVGSCTYGWSWLCTASDKKALLGLIALIALVPIVGVIVYCCCCRGRAAKQRAQREEEEAAMAKLKEVPPPHEPPTYPLPTPAPAAAPEPQRAASPADSAVAPTPAPTPSHQ